MLREIVNVFLYHEDATLNEERQLNEIRPQHYVFSTQNRSS